MQDSGEVQVKRSNDDKRERLLALLVEREDGQGDRFYPLSFSQERLWFLDQFQPGSTAYNVPAAFYLSGRVDPGVLRAAFATLIERQEQLRVVFATVGGQPRQWVKKHIDPAYLELDLRHLPADRAAEASAARLAEEIQTPFDLRKGPLLRLTLIHERSDRCCIVICAHHIICDAWSMAVLFRELTALYNSGGRPQGAGLPALPIQYGDFAVWQREQARDGKLKQQLDYWAAWLAGAPPGVELPPDQPRPPVATGRGASRPVMLSEELSSSVAALARANGATPYMVLLAGFAVLLGRLAGERDLVIGSPVANRNRIETENLIGFFINTLIMRVRLPAGIDFSSLLSQIKETTLGAYANQDIPFERLVEALQPERDLSRNPLFQIVFGYQNTPDIERLAGTGAGADDDAAVTPGTAKFDLSLMLGADANGVIGGGIEYSTDLFEHATIARLVERFKLLLADLVAAPDRPVARARLMSIEERQWLLGGCQPKPAAIPEGNPARWFERQVARHPDAVAVADDRGHLSYAELEELANRLAHALIARGVCPGDRVALCLPRGTELLAGILAVLKTGAAYLPLDPANPRERLNTIASDAAARLIVGLLEHRSLVEALDIPAFHWDENDLGRYPNTPPAVAEEGDDSAVYMIYTSGSTGRPKGSVITRRGFANLVHWYHGTFSLTAADRCLVISSPGFDLTQKNLLTPLIVGGQVHFYRGAHYDPEAIVAMIAREDITFINCTPSAFYPIADCGGRRLVSLRYVFLGGEPITVKRLWPWLRICANTEVVNTYGPTECTDVVAYYRLEDPSAFLDKPVPIGQPVANTQLFVLDKDDQFCPTGVVGELAVAGAGVSRGYFNRPALTARKFIDNPYADENAGSRLYLTGDLVKRRADGNLDFIQRLDHQVKIRGHRIEIREIEQCLVQSPSVKEAAVVVLGREENARLAAYVVCRDGASPGDPLSDNPRRHLKTLLPDYMIPATITALDALPLSPNGKVDYLALQARGDAVEKRSGSVAPRDAVEEVVAGLWMALLETDDIGVHDNFFERGGHSLLATQILARLRQIFSAETPLRALFEHKTVAALAAALKGDPDREEPAVTTAAKVFLRVVFMSDREVDARLSELACGENGEHIPTVLEEE